MRTHQDESLFILDTQEFMAAREKRGDENKLVFAVMLKFLQTEGRYPSKGDLIPDSMITSLASQLGCDFFPEFDLCWDTYTSKRFRQEIRALLGYKKLTVKTCQLFMNWLIDSVLPQVPTLEQCRSQVYAFFREQKIEPFSIKQVDRHIHSAHQQFEKQFFEKISNQLPSQTKKALDRSLTDGDEKENTESEEKTIDLGSLQLRHLKKDTAELKLDSILYEIKKYTCLKNLGFPKELFSNISRKLLKKYHDRILSEFPSSIKEHKPSVRYAKMAIFCHCRSQMLVDTLADLLLKLIHRLQTKAEKYVKNYVLSEVRRVNGKFDILFLLANTSLQKPDGIIQDEIYSQVDEETLKALVKDLSHRSKWYQTEVQTKMLSLYTHNNRRIVLALLEVLPLQTNHPDAVYFIQAIQFILKNRNVKDPYYSDSSSAFFNKTIPNSWRSLIVEQQGQATESYKIKPFPYEIAVLESFFPHLNCKNVWVEGGYRYGNPQEEVPKDFDENPDYYFNLLGITANADEFVTVLKRKLDQSLEAFNNSLPTNKKVKVSDKKGGRFRVSPSYPQEEPLSLKVLHQEIHRRWSTVNLIDVLKETDLRVGFTKHFHSVASREGLDKSILQKRLLLSLYAIGSNTGLKRMSAGCNGENHEDLRYVKRRYIHCQQVRRAIIEVINSILEIRDPAIWSEATTGCVCDSKKLAVWDQNLIAEWHMRYRGRGVMVYWHVDKKSVCIYSQIKTCSSSEVGSMITGVLRHDTEMNMNSVYVDTHGQSAIGFAFSYLLNFDLLPRLKNINKQKLYVSSSAHKERYANLKSVLASEVINWKLIETNYKEAVKQAAALKVGTVEADVMIRKFSKDNYNHPVYKALLEIGKAVRTIFLCRYLSSEELRIEIHESLNVVERVNSIMGFIFYGRLGEISTNNKEDQELAILCLHLIQVCMTYINTLMIQEVLNQPLWKNLLAKDDKRALNPLIYSHFNPYGLFILNMDHRIPLKHPVRNREGLSL